MRTIFRTKLTDNFTTLPNSFLRDKSLSFKARGMLAMILSNRGDWEVSAGWLQNQGLEGKEAIRGGLNELKSAGYAIFKQIKGDDGKFTGTCWTFYDFPQKEPVAGNPASGLAPSGLPVGDNQPPHKDYSRSTIAENNGDQREEGADAPPLLSSEPLSEPAAEGLEEARPNPRSSSPTPRVKPRAEPALMVTIPLDLNNRSFLQAWEDWVADRRERRKPVTSAAARLQLRDCERWGSERAVAAIRHSIKSGYTGIFEPSDRSPGVQRPKNFAEQQGYNL